MQGARGAQKSWFFRESLASPPFMTDPAGKPHSLFHSIHTVFTASLAVQVLTVLKGFVIAYLLGPALLGVWRMVTIIFSYLEYAQFGIVKSLNIDLVLSLGRGETDRVRAIKDQVVSWLAVLTVWWIFVIVSIETSGLYRFGGILAWLPVYMAVYLPLNYLFRYLTEILKAEQRFPILNRVKVVNGIFLFCASIFGAYYFGVQGLAVGTLIVTAVTVGYNYRLQGERFRWKMDWDLSKTLYRSGGGGMISEVATVLFLTVDGLMIYHLLGEKDLGVYAFAVQIVALINFAASAVTQVFHPTIGYEVGGGSENPGLLIRYLSCGSLLTWLVALAGFGASFLLYPSIISWFFKDYGASILISQILSFGMLFLSLRLIYSAFLLVTKSFATLNSLLIAGIFVNVGINYWVYTMGYGVNGFAGATAFCQVVLGLTILVMAGRSGPAGTLSALLVELGRQVVLLVFGASMLALFFLLVRTPAYRNVLGLGYFPVYLGAVGAAAYWITPRDYRDILLSTPIRTTL